MGLWIAVKQKLINSKLGFTLLELSIILVIISFLIGGILTGRELMKSAEVRAQISQIEKLQVSVNTFKEKYNEIPGDMLSSNATAFGFFASSYGPARAMGDGNGILESGGLPCGAAGAINCLHGEFSMFWRHLSDAKMIDKAYVPDSMITSYVGPNVNLDTLDKINKFIPAAKIGNGASITLASYRGNNYFEIGGFNKIQITNGYYGNNHGSFAPTNPITGYDAYRIDVKIDDGKPNTGVVLAVDLTNNISYNLWEWVTTSTITDCVTNGTDYTLSNTTIAACSLSFKFK